MSTLSLDGGPRKLDLYELAMLSGGADLAIATAAAQLHEDGLLKARADGTLQSVAGLLETARRGPFGRPRLRPTRAGRRLVEDLCTERPELRGHPSSGEAAQATALFGGGSLWLAEPQLASALGVPREAKRHGAVAHSGAWGGGGGG